MKASALEAQLTKALETGFLQDRGGCSAQKLATNHPAAGEELVVTEQLRSPPWGIGGCEAPSLPPVCAQVTVRRGSRFPLGTPAPGLEGMPGAVTHWLSHHEVRLGLAWRWDPDDEPGLVPSPWTECGALASHAQKWTRVTPRIKPG